MSGSIDEALKGTFQRIHDQGKKKAQLALEAIAWVLLAFRPLTLTELRHAVSIEVGTSYFDEEDIVSDCIIRYCLGVLVEGPNSTVHFMHFTLGEFLESTHHLVLGIGHDIIAQKCITHMMHKLISCEGYYDHLVEPKGRPPSCLILRSCQAYRRFPLLNYAAKFWGGHIRNAQDESKETEELALHFILSFMDRIRFSRLFLASGEPWCGWYFSQDIRLTKGNTREWKVPIFQLLSHFGLCSLWKHVRERFPELRPTEVRDDWNRTPLLYARHKDMVELISKELPQDLHRFGGELLLLSYQGGRHDIVRWLLQKPDIDVNFTFKRRHSGPASYTGKKLIHVCKEEDIRRALIQHPRFWPDFSSEQYIGTSLAIEIEFSVLSRSRGSSSLETYLEHIGLGGQRLDRWSGRGNSDQTMVCSDNTHPQGSKQCSPLCGQDQWEDPFSDVFLFSMSMDEFMYRGHVLEKCQYRSSG